VCSSYLPMSVVLGVALGGGWMIWRWAHITQHTHITQQTFWAAAGWTNIATSAYRNHQWFNAWMDYEPTTHTF
jgi:hypothetical protein